MTELTQVIRGVKQTEKGARLSKLNQYILWVAREANKIQIKEAAEELFQVTVKAVNTLTMPGKWRRVTKQRGQRPNWKKAVVTLAAGQKIELK
ncbi:MAG TPA: 50S ribosomal protein L23 [Candidatus Omnitrophica bacterium]|nr:MAG: 50S ribosomal protein L23 [Omnitrophica WOR_2 bacterium GWA2_63_20]OGX16758.1 MAG: 50S ribosomal protein L23 [Omnitrophica WOR_2 bacterium GWF2_63_9]OGX32198.1 MAG: 50S ribosomal protein L23 [Omnitrophica WOR_2 bacterium RIFCSPHIGHO2_12_FULL_64_13]OGX36684.1 MAG: 50S ribosomal protein L23 [Omnitrophica WOR_2 bacterium RIFCSPHIGHO2_02_FULL_63_39]OGX45014.1 MAG: 50S ribosomal protein L23 [Omnitrophica WOR_2 bacterium RIFCSPLOWO2_02_FULL_63_16]OGX49982.1 MAG: 50S ribosomal protein L23 [Om